MRASSHFARRSLWVGALRAACVALPLAGVVACSPSSLVDVQSPSTVVDPSLLESASAAAQLRTGALAYFMASLGRLGNSSVIGMSGMITDELASTSSGDSPYGSSGAEDTRNVLNFALGGDQGGYSYDYLQSARVKALQARQALQLYAQDAPAVPRAWQGEMYALEGYTILYFAELYCSGIPLTVVPLSGAQELTRGFTTQEMFERAITLFDSAMVAGADSAQFVSLASVGKGRALLGLGRFASADSAVRSVPTNFLYLIHGYTGYDGTNYLAYSMGAYRAQDHEGGNGLVWSTDPRTAIVTLPDAAGAMLWPAKYHVTPSGTLDPMYGDITTPFRVADGLEARLIQAEAALAAGNGGWLDTLNMLRSTCVGTVNCAPVPGLTTSSLPPLADPGTAAARLDLVMKERAMWLYMTGHREGDLRRMAHVYGRDRNTLWPTGTISAPAFPPLYNVPLTENGTSYGPDVVYGPDVNEHLRNPLYGGCYDTNP